VGGPGNGVSVLAGNGDGTFQAPMVVPTKGAHSGVAVGDLNGDGRADIAVAEGNTVGILLGGV
jgi:VCBS repeat protein